MSSFVLDASATLAILLPDEQVMPAAIKFLKLMDDPHNQFISCSLLEVEVANGIRSAIRRKRITENEGVKILGDLKQLPYAVISLNILSILEIATRYDLSVYDACYAFLAKEKQSQLISLDEKLLKCVEKMQSSPTPAHL